MAASLAALRADSIDFPLFLHVLGATLLVGSLVLILATLVVAWRGGVDRNGALVRFAFRSLLFAAIPSWVLARVAGQWTASREGYDGDDDPAWLGVGFLTMEPGLVLLLIATILTGLAARRGRAESSRSSTLARVATVLTGVLLAAYLVAVWAMTTKPD